MEETKPKTRGDLLTAQEKAAIEFDNLMCCRCGRKVAVLPGNIRLIQFMDSRNGQTTVLFCADCFGTIRSAEGFIRLFIDKLKAAYYGEGGRILAEVWRKNAAEQKERA